MQKNLFAFNDDIVIYLESHLYSYNKLSLVREIIKSTNKIYCILIDCLEELNKYSTN